MKAAAAVIDGRANLQPPAAAAPLSGGAGGKPPSRSISAELEMVSGAPGKWSAADPRWRDVCFDLDR